MYSPVSLLSGIYTLPGMHSLLVTSDAIMGNQGSDLSLVGEASTGGLIYKASRVARGTRRYLLGALPKKIRASFLNFQVS